MMVSLETVAERGVTGREEEEDHSARNENDVEDDVGHENLQTGQSEAVRCAFSIATENQPLAVGNRVGSAAEDIKAA
jgi:hypothetical protein